MNYQEFQRQLESTSGLSDWKYSKDESDFNYFRAMRNNGQFQIVYSESEYRYDWNAKRCSETMRIEKDCFSLQGAIEFLNMAIAVTETNSGEEKDMKTVTAIGLLLIGLAIGWISAIATVQGSPSYAPSSTVERS